MVKDRLSRFELDILRDSGDLPLGVLGLGFRAQGFRVGTEWVALGILECRVQHLKVWDLWALPSSQVELI